MAIFKCKMCGGNLEIAEGTTVCECEYCGTKQTLPKSSDEQQLNLINRANHFRQQCEFDKAMEIYERMLQRDDSDAEIYWSIVLCRYGIEYVDDPATGKKIPTCHRAQFTLITQDADYLEALSHADAIQKEVYQSEAEYIANVQKGILEISNKEDPFDVFICYKETDENGQRTQDSVLAQELYYQLTQEGFKVFFSRITLEDKLGSAYEPYIFAALNSSKVMVVVGTKPEYFNAVWVKNEWSRYLLLMKEDHSKTLIPAYKGMDPYDLPDALSMFQAQDMSKLGFMQDLIRGIKKIAGSSKESAPQSSRSDSRPVNSKADNLVKRGFMSLEDGDMQKAGSYFEQALNENAEEARAYEGLLLVELNVRNEADLGNLPETFDDRNNYKKAIRFADDQLRERLSGYNEAIRNHILDNAYESAKTQLENAYSFDDVKAGVTGLLQVKGRGSANDILFDTACKYSEDTNLERLNLALLILKEIPDHPGAEDIIYKMGTRFEEETDAEKLSFCVSALEIISDRDGVAEKITALKAIISDIEARTAEKKKHDYDEKINKWRSDFADGLVELNLESYAMDLNDCYRYKINYKEGKRLIAASGYDKDHYFENKAENIVNAISNLIDDTNRTLGEKRRRYAFAAGGSFILSLVLFIVAFSIGFQDKYNSITYNTMTLFMVLASVVLVLGVVFALIRNSCQVDVKDFLSYTKYINACKELKKAIETDAFHDSELKELYEIRKSEKSNAKRTDGSSGSQKNADRKKSSGAVGVVIIIVCIIGGIVGGVLFFTHFLPSNKYNDAIALMNNGSYEEAITLFTELGKYKDSRSLIAQCHQYIANEEAQNEDYTSAVEMMNKGEYLEAEKLFTSLGDYQDSKELAVRCSAKYLLSAWSDDSEYKEKFYNIGNKLMHDYADYDTAITIFTKLGFYQDSNERLSECYILKADILFDEGRYNDALTSYNKSRNQKGKEERIKECKYYLGVEQYNLNNFLEALNYFEDCDDFADSETYLLSCQESVFNEAVDSVCKEQYYYARELLKKITNYDNFEYHYKLCDAACRYYYHELNVDKLILLCEEAPNDDLASRIYYKFHLDKIKELFLYYSGDYLCHFYYNDSPDIDYTTAISLIDYQVYVATRSSYAKETIDDYIASGRKSGISCNVFARDDGLYAFQNNDMYINVSFSVNTSSMYDSIDVYDSYSGGSVEILTGDYYLY